MNPESEEQCLKKVLATHQRGPKTLNDAIVKCSDECALGSTQSLMCSDEYSTHQSISSDVISLYLFLQLEITARLKRYEK